MAQKQLERKQAGSWKLDMLLLAAVFVASLIGTIVAVRLLFWWVLVDHVCVLCEGERERRGEGESNADTHTHTHTHTLSLSLSLSPSFFCPGLVCQAYAP